MTGAAALVVVGVVVGVVEVDVLVGEDVVGGDVVDGRDDEVTGGRACESEPWERDHTV